jgi:hypothetical protein
VLPATFAASLLTVASGAAAVQVVSAGLGHPMLRDAGRVLYALTWRDPAVQAAGGGLVAAGLLFVLSAALPGRTRTEALAGADPRFVTGLGRASLCAIVHAAAVAVPGVTAARVRLRARPRPRVRILAATAYPDPGNLEEQVAYAVRERLADLGPVRVPEVAVRIAVREER